VAAGQPVEPAVTEPEPDAPAEAAGTQAPGPEPGPRAPASEGDISPARLDQALQRLRDGIPAREDGPLAQD
jgi:hypothetical protein